MFRICGLCITAILAYAAASRKPLTIVSLIDNEPMTKNGKFRGGETDKIEEFKAEIVTPRIKIWNSEDMVLHVINKTLRWETDSGRDSALWTYVPVSNEGGMLSGKGGLCLFRDEDLISLRGCPGNPNSLISEYMFKLDIEANPNDLKRCEKVVEANREEKIRKRETGNVESQKGSGSRIKDRGVEPSAKERGDIEPKRGARENDGLRGAVESGNMGYQYPKDSNRGKYENKEGGREYPRLRENDRDISGEPVARNTYKYPERGPKDSEYSVRPRLRAPERGPQEDINRRDFDELERGDRSFDKEFRGDNSNQSNFSRNGSSGNYRGSAKDREMPREQNRDYSRQSQSASCKDDPLSCGLFPENNRKSQQQGSSLDENALNTLIQLIKKFQQEKLNNRSDPQRT